MIQKPEVNFFGGIEQKVVASVLIDVEEDEPGEWSTGVTVVPHGLGIKALYEEIPQSLETRIRIGEEVLARYLNTK